MVIDSVTYQKISHHFSKPHTVRSITKMSPVGQTARIESYHRVVLSFAPKHLSFGFHGMYARYVFACWNIYEYYRNYILLTLYGE